MKLNNLKSFIKNNLKWIILFLCVIGFLVIVGYVLEDKIINGDIIGYNIISKHLISASLTPIVKAITNLGSTDILLILSIILFIIIKNKKIGFSIIINFGIVAVLNIILKNILQRPRPTDFRLIDESGYSFPSGHAMISMAVYGFLIYLIFKYIKNKYLKWILITILSILIVSIGVSRIYLGVHYTSDVIAGFLISISYLILYISIIKNKI